MCHQTSSSRMKLLLTFTSGGNRFHRVFYSQAKQNLACLKLTFAFCRACLQTHKHTHTCTLLFSFTVCHRVSRLQHQLPALKENHLCSPRGEGTPAARFRRVSASSFTGVVTRAACDERYYQQHVDLYQLHPQGLKYWISF